jgi:hypothetical protein
MHDEGDILDEEGCENPEEEDEGFREMSEQMLEELPQ